MEPEITAKPTSGLMKPQSAAVVCSEETWVRGHGASHPLKPERLRRTYELLAAYGVFDGSHFARDSVSAIQETTRARWHLGEDDHPKKERSSGG